MKGFSFTNLSQSLNLWSDKKVLQRQAIYKLFQLSINVVIFPIPIQGIGQCFRHGAELALQFFQAFVVAEMGAPLLLFHEFDSGSADEHRLFRDSVITFIDQGNYTQHEQWHFALRRFYAADTGERLENAFHVHVIAGCQVAFSGSAACDRRELMLCYIPGIDNGKTSRQYAGQFLSDKVEQELS